MSLTLCKIQIMRQSTQSILASPDLLTSLGITSGRSILLTLGSKSVRIGIRKLSRSGKIMLIPQVVASRLMIPHSGGCMAVRRGKHEIRLGPMIGLLTTFGNSNPPFGSRNLLMKQFISSGKNRSFYFAFTPNGVDWENKTVLGYFPQSSGAWLKKRVPFPDVIYNRLPSRRSEKQASIIRFKSSFVKQGIPVFNWSFFEKWDVYRLLQNESEYKYIPESYINPSSNEIRQLLEKHQVIYLKPTGGSLGIGIYRLTYNSRRGYFARYRRGGRNILMRYSHFDDLMKMLLRQNRGRLSHYVVQQGIRLLEIDSCPIDFRFHLTKNGNNKWIISAIGAKKAGKGSVTTHVRTGGVLMTPEHVLGTLYGARASQVLQSTKDKVISLAEAIERNYPHILGELGFDIGIDKSENIWMFEANSKPGRSIFRHPQLKSQGRDSLAHLFEHCLYLSKFRPGRDGG